MRLRTLVPLAGLVATVLVPGAQAGYHPVEVGHAYLYPEYGSGVFAVLRFLDDGTRVSVTGEGFGFSDVGGQFTFVCPKPVFPQPERTCPPRPEPPRPDPTCGSNPRPGCPDPCPRSPYGLTCPFAGVWNTHAGYGELVVTQPGLGRLRDYDFATVHDVADGGQPEAGGWIWHGGYSGECNPLQPDVSLCLDSRYATQLTAVSAYLPMTYPYRISGYVDNYRFTVGGNVVNVPCVRLAVDGTGANPCATAGGTFVNRMLYLVDTYPGQPTGAVYTYPAPSVYVCEATVTATVAGRSTRTPPVPTPC